MPLLAVVSIVNGSAALCLQYAFGLEDAGNGLKLVKSLGNLCFLVEGDHVEAMHAFAAGTLFVFAGIREYAVVRCYTKGLHG